MVANLILDSRLATAYSHNMLATIEAVTAGVPSKCCFGIGP